MLYALVLNLQIIFVIFEQYAQFLSQKDKKSPFSVPKKEPFL